MTHSTLAALVANAEAIGRTAGDCYRSTLAARVDALETDNRQLRADMNAAGRAIDHLVTVVERIVALLTEPDNTGDNADPLPQLADGDATLQ